ncbi:MAG: HEAT repeat domain-containing protein [Acidobacteriota bacterium]|nr:HEAT repeat domain-containing protein [Acidobacteriota bacterium]
MNLPHLFQNQKIRQAFWSLLALWLTASVVLAQVPGRTDSLQAELLARLASGNEEQRADAVIELGSRLSAISAEPATVDALSNLLQRDASPMVRSLTARAIEFSRDDRFVTALLAGLKSEREISVRKATIYALAFQKSSQVVGALLPLLKDKKQEIRAAVVLALAEIGDPISKDSLIDLLKKRSKDEDIFARNQAARALGNMPGQASVDALIASLNRDKSQEVRRASAQALGMIASKQDAKVVEALKFARQDVDPYLVSVAETALSRIISRNP